MIQGILHPWTQETTTEVFENFQFPLVIYILLKVSYAAMN